MNIAGSTLLATRVDLPAACDRLATLGFTRVDIGVLEGWAHLDPSRIAADTEWAIDRLRSACRRADLEPVAFNANPGDASTDVQAERMAALAAVGEALGVEVATVNAAPTSEPLATDLERLDRLVAAVAEYDMTLAVEGHQGTHTENPAVARKYVETVPGLAFTLDPGHFAIGEYWEDGSGYDPLLEHTAHVHLRQANRSNIQVLDEAGIIDVDDVITRLRSTGYDATLSVEYVDTLVDEEYTRLEEAARSMRGELTRALN